MSDNPQHDQPHSDGTASTLPEAPAEGARHRPRWRQPIVVVPVLVVGALVFGVGMYLFQPWKIFVDETVVEDLPTAAAPSADPAEESGVGPADDRDSAVDPPPAAPTEPVVLSSGTFISHEHATTGTVQIVQLPDGNRILRLENLDTSNGPDLKVWLTDAPVIEGTAGWGVFDDGNWVDLGALKGNKGSQNYEIPADVDLDGFSSVSIWCDRFNVSFGAAELQPAG